MEFDIYKFSIKFRASMDWMLRDKFGGEIKRDISSFVNRRGKLDTEPDCLDALRLLVELLVTDAWYYKKPAGFDSYMNSFLARHGEGIRKVEARNELVTLIDKLGPPRIRNRAKDSIQKLLTDYSSLKQFTEQLYALALQDKSDVLGEKGRDNYLRDFGYWDRVPIDRHEMRFIIRTGIYHAFSVRDRNDPLEKGSLQHSLAFFCDVYLGGKPIEGIELSNAPGIVDIFIWSYCAKERYAICGSTPRCHDCQLSDSCLLGCTNIQRLYELGRIEFSKGPNHS
jgi:hypothetical protein